MNSLWILLFAIFIGACSTTGMTRRPSAESQIPQPAECSLNIRESGSTASGITVVLLHGGPGMLGVMGDIAKELAAKVHVIDYDQRAEINGCTGPYQILDHIEDLDQIVASRATGKVVLVGHSWGAVLALKFTISHPEKVNKIIMVDSAAFDSVSFNQFQNTIASRLNPTDLAELTDLQNKMKSSSTVQDQQKYAVASQKLLILKGYTYSKQPLPLEIRWWDLPSYHETWNDYLKQISNSSLILGAEKISVPIAVIHGVYDPYPAQAIVGALKSKMLNPKFELLEKSGHIPWIEPDAKPIFLQELVEQVTGL